MPSIELDEDVIRLHAGEGAGDPVSVACRAWVEAHPPPIPDNAPPIGSRWRRVGEPEIVRTVDSVEWVRRDRGQFPPVEGWLVHSHIPSRKYTLNNTLDLDVFVEKYRPYDVLPRWSVLSDGRVVCAARDLQPGDKVGGEPLVAVDESSGYDTVLRWERQDPSYLDPFTVVQLDEVPS